jgi:hypothetical protein
LGKRSKRGVLQLIKDEAGNYQTVREDAEDTIQFSRKIPSSKFLKVRYQNGKLYNRTTFDKVRANVLLLARIQAAGELRLRYLAKLFRLTLQPLFSYRTMVQLQKLRGRMNLSTQVS